MGCQEAEDDAIPTIRVIAPARLQEGFTFEVLVDGEPFTVRVPKGGVKEGQEFEVLYDREEDNSKKSKTETSTTLRTVSKLPTSTHFPFDLPSLLRPLRTAATRVNRP